MQKLVLGLALLLPVFALPVQDIFDLARTFVLRVLAPPGTGRER